MKVSHHGNKHVQTKQQNHHHHSNNKYNNMSRTKTTTAAHLLMCKLGDVLAVDGHHQITFVQFGTSLGRLTEKTAKTDIS